MDITGNILEIKNKRSDLHKAIEVHMDRVEYVTEKKDGRYYQPFEYIDELSNPLIITGDCLARKDTKYLDEGEYEFAVYDKLNGEFILNPNKKLEISTEYIEEDDITIVTAGTYTITVSNEEFNTFKNSKAKEKSWGKKKK